MAAACIAGAAGAFSLLIILRWPVSAQVDWKSAMSLDIFRMFGYGLMTALLLLSPVFPATSIVKEKRHDTLMLLLNSPLRRWSIYFGKLFGCLGVIGILVLMSVPAAAACYAMGGISLAGDIGALYGVLLLSTLQCACLGMCVSVHANTTDSALRITYGCVLALTVLTLGPHYFLQGEPGMLPVIAEWLRCLSPISAVMDVLSQADAGQVFRSESLAGRYALLSSAMCAILSAITLFKLDHRILDRARSQGVITNERSMGGQAVRLMVFLVDPQRRKAGIGPLSNPVMVKEFRCRRFGRLHWMMRLAAASAIVSLALTFAATVGSEDWGPESIGGVMVLLQASLIVLLTPSLAAGLISSEVESGGWQQLKMTPLSAITILTGKLSSVIWPVFLILVSTLPGYIVMVYIDPQMWLQVQRILVCLAFTAGFSIAVSTCVSSLCNRTTVSTTLSYSALLIVCVGTMLFWVLRDAPFGHSTVEAALTLNPIAAALTVINTPGFTQYSLIPGNWWFVVGAMTFCVVVVTVRTIQLTRPQ
jgi:ABC-type transport system involved in multi-copper enzyme maturation permease subunit